MGFNFGAFLGGGAKKLVEDAEQERQDVVSPDDIFKSIGD